MADGHRVPVILSFDCEPDQEVWSLDDPSAWSGFENMTNASQRLRDLLESATGMPAHFSWMLRMDPQIAASYSTPTFLPEHFPDFFESIDRIGDSTGVHCHAWRWDAKETTWTADHEDPQWVSTCVGTAYESYREAFGRTPALHSFGSTFMSTEIMNQVRDAGSAFDLTLAPGEPPEASGRHAGVVWKGDLPGGLDLPRYAYCPDRSDFRRVADVDDGFRAVPLSSGRYIPPVARRRVAHPMRTARGAIRRLADFARPAPEDTSPPYRLLGMWRDWRSPSDFWDSAFAAAADLEPPYLSFEVRTDGGDRTFMLERFFAIITGLVKDPRAARLTFTTLERDHGVQALTVPDPPS